MPTANIRGLFRGQSYCCLNGGKIDLTVADGKFLGSIVKPGAAAAAVGDDGTVMTVADGCGMDRQRIKMPMPS